MSRSKHLLLFTAMLGCSFETGSTGAGSADIGDGESESTTSEPSTSAGASEVTSGSGSQGGTTTSDDTSPITTASGTTDATAGSTSELGSTSGSESSAGSTGTTDVCAEADCDPNAACDGSSGTAECTCHDGFFGDGATCTAVELAMLRVELPCVNADQCGSSACAMQETDEASVSLVGDPSLTYSVTLRFRGVIEEKSYVGGGPQDGYFHPDGTPTAGGYNQFGLEVDDPAGTYALNSGTSGFNHCFPLDEEHVVQIQGGSGLRLFANNGADICGIRNVDDDGDPIVVADIPPDPNAFDGQFIQIDVVGIAAP